MGSSSECKKFNREQLKIAQAEKAPKVNDLKPTDKTSEEVISVGSFSVRRYVKVLKVQSRNCFHLMTLYYYKKCGCVGSITTRNAHFRPKELEGMYRDSVDICDTCFEKVN